MDWVALAASMQLQDTTEDDAAAVKQQVVHMLLGEVVLCTGEVSKRTRDAAYTGLVEVSKTVHAEDPDSKGVSK